MYPRKRPTSQRSPEIIAGNDDLLTELILLYLPAKSLVRFQSVCKHWHSLISDPVFSNHHLRLRRSKPQSTFIFRCSAKPQFFYFNLTTTDSDIRPFNFKAPFTRILQSCNGLLLVECRNFRYGLIKSYCVYNPTTGKQSIILFPSSRVYTSGLCLAFDPLKSPHYKVVCFRRNYSKANYKIEVYNSESQTWNCIRDNVNSWNANYWSANFWNAIYRKNRIYWIRHSSWSKYLDLETGDLGTLPPLSIPRRKGQINNNCIMESNGHIHCVSTYLSQKAKSLIIYELSDDDSVWYNKYLVDLNPISSAILPSMFCRVIGISNEDSSVLLQSCDQVICHRFSDGSFEVVRDLNKDVFGEFQGSNIYQFVHSLVPV